MTLMATNRCSFSSNAFTTIPKPPLPEDLQHLVMRQPAQRAGLLRRLQEAQGALDIVAALVVERLDRCRLRPGIPRACFRAARRSKTRHVLGRIV